MNTPVKFELAKLLKEKGFDVKNRTQYQMYGTQNIPQLEPYNDTKLNIYKDYYLAPTIAEVVMWLYEKHEYWCYTYTNGKMWYPCIQHKFGDMAVLSGKIGTYNSSIEAYEEAIKYTLNNLI